jgi:hypothetical protein
VVGEGGGDGWGDAWGDAGGEGEGCAFASTQTEAIDATTAKIAIARMVLLLLAARFGAFERRELSEGIMPAPRKWFNARRWSLPIGGKNFRSNLPEFLRRIGVKD